MATILEATIQQSTGEVRKWAADFTNDLPTGVTVTGGTATHTPPSGSAATVAVTYSSPYVYAQLGPLTVTGIHYLDVQATFSDGEKSEVRIAFTVNYPAVAARSGMTALITSLRALTEAGPNDYSVAGLPYWSDAQLQRVLDYHRVTINHQPLEAVGAIGTGGAVTYTEYRTNLMDWESDPIIQDENDNTLTVTTTYTFDSQLGIVTFGANTTGLVRYITGKAYNLAAAAADIWNQKAAHYASAIDFSTDNMRMSRSQLMAHCREMAFLYGQKSAGGSIYMERRDTDA